MSAATDTQTLRELYRALVLDHARNPRHFGKLSDASHSADGINPLCGDKLTLYLSIDDQDRVAAVSFEGSGCAISVASASLLTETITGCKTEDARRYFETVTARLNGGEGDAETTLDLGELRALEGVRDFPSRIKCATLAWHALDAALRNSCSPASTE